MKRKWIRKAPIFILFVAAAWLAIGSVTMLLWNNILHVVLHIGLINFWQATGILLLARILFGFPHRRHFGGHRNGRCCRMFSKWRNLSPEERERIKEKWRSRDQDLPTAGGLETV